MNHQVIFHHRVFKPYNSKERRKALLQGSIPTPQILPKTNVRTIPHFKSNKISKNLPSPPNMLPNTYSKRTQSFS